MVTYKSEDKYNTYARKLYHVVPPSSEIPFIEWVKVFEHLILDMQSQNSEVCDINRATDAVIQMIAKGVVTSEEYKMQLVEAYPQLGSGDMYRALGSNTRVNIYMLFSLIRFKLNIT